MSDPEVKTATTPAPPRKTEQNELVLEQLVPVPIVEVPIQPSVDNQLGGSYIMETGKSCKYKMTVVIPPFLV